MEEKEHGKLKTILFICFPIIFIVIFGVFILNFLGIPVVKTLQDWGNKVPVLNNIIPDPAPKLVIKSDGSNDWKKKYLQNEQVLKEKDQKIAELNKEINSNQKEDDNLKKSNDELQKQLEKKQTQKFQDQMKQIAGIYANMQSSKAASILESMSLADASFTVSLLEQDQQSSILESMKDAKKAASITMMLNEIAMLPASDQTSLKVQIQDLAQKQESPTETLAETIAGMPPSQSAVIIKTMMGSNSQVAMELMKNVSTNSRSQILAEITKTDAKLAAQITSSLN
jgi:flagellar motility protein MotE (MotC chaperone)